METQGRAHHPSRVMEGNETIGISGGTPSPNPVKVRQTHRRYRALFHQAAREYQGWCQGEEDAQRALNSVCHLLDRMLLLDPQEKGDRGCNSLGGLEQLPGLVTGLMFKHTSEAERMMRLASALAGQMRSQLLPSPSIPLPTLLVLGLTFSTPFGGKVSRVQAILSDAWQLHLSETAAGRSSPSMPGRTHPPPTTPCSRTTSSLSGVTNIGGGPHDQDVMLPLPSPVEEVALGEVSTPGHGEVEIRRSRGSIGSIQHGGGGATPGRGQGGEGVGRTGPGPSGGRDGGAGQGPSSADYMLWIMDMAGMLGHEQYRKEEMIAAFDFGQDRDERERRESLLSQWPSSAEASFLDRGYLDKLLDAAHVPKLMQS